LYWESGETDKAEQHYRDILAMAKEHNSALDRMAALAGLANCFQRHGNYNDAIHYGKQALSIARKVDYSSLIDIALRLSRWYSELGQRKSAAHMLNMADQEAGMHEDPALRVQCLVERARLMLDAGDALQAWEEAQQALAGAPLWDGSMTVLQARTTIAMACLISKDEKGNNDRMAAARREIGRASLRRRGGESLVVLALQALIEFRDGPYEIPSRAAASC
jgi:ATP/maltotriose-dependent transcriptional regulator MalT